MRASARTPSLKGQFKTCLLFIALAIGITLWLHPAPVFLQWSTGIPMREQFALAAVFAALCAAGAVIALKLPSIRDRIPVPPVLRDTDLSGARPLAIGLLAGVGEEALFRAALQPLIGLWAASIVFAAAHLRTAALGAASHAKRGLYLLNVALGGVGLGLVFEHAGLVAAILFHATIDIAGLFVLRRVIVSQARATARAAI
ncbi:MAG: CPBP family intramembrane metalloprotease [Burkholderiales bacterium]|jgi:membrane protease YdiL (CAAX protease family)|nr:CPBP family intramembrane metalloprotease [Burkholderiales bacterium]